MQSDKESAEDYLNFEDIVIVVKDILENKRLNSTVAERVHLDQHMLQYLVGDKPTVPLHLIFDCRFNSLSDQGFFWIFVFSPTHTYAATFNL